MTAGGASKSGHGSHHGPHHGPHHGAQHGTHHGSHRGSHGGEPPAKHAEPKPVAEPDLQFGPDPISERVLFSQVRAVFEEALDLAPVARKAFLQKACGNDEPLRRGVERMLRLHAEGLRAAETPSRARPPDSRELLAALQSGLPLQPGARVGTWKLLRRLGSGGMGEVWEAEQERPKRHAALKVVRAGLPGTRARQRFHDEVDTLARLQHPGIARILEAGEHTEPGGEVRPWYAMELVTGARTLTAWAKQRHLPWRKRLSVFRTVCEAVDHGHRNGVIHRDLKPSNILVGEDGHPRVIDFGVARVTADAGVAEGALARRTQAGELVGTLATMAPEQLDGHADVRSDVYALGVVLHELLAGEPPYDVAGLSLTEAARVVREELPPPPGDTAPDLPLEADWIVGKALEKDPDDRYPSVSALSEDLRRLLADEPVDASPPSRTYRLKKFAKRHRVGVAAGGAIALLLVAGIAGTSIGLVRANKAATAATKSGQAADSARKKETAARQQESVARAEAERAAAEATAVTGFLTDVFGSASPAQDGNDARVVDALQRAEDRMGPFLKDHPQAERTLRAAIGTLDVELGRYEDGERNLVRALAIPAAPVTTALAGATPAGGIKPTSTRAEPAHDPTLGDTELRLRLAQARQRLGRLDEAEAELQAAVDQRTAAFGADSPHLVNPLNLMASLRNQQGRVEEAEALYRQAIELAVAANGADHLDVARMQSSFADFLMGQRRFGEADTLLADSLELQQRHAADVDPGLLAQTLSDLAGVRMQQQRIDESAKLMDELLALQSKRLPPDHREVLACRANLASLRFYQGRVDEALSLTEEVLSGKLRSSPPWDLEMVTMLANIGQMKVASGASDDAVRAVARRLVETGAGERATDPRVAYHFLYFADYIRDVRSLVPEALALAGQAVAVYDRLQPHDLPEPLQAHAFHAWMLALAGRNDEARAELEEIGRLDGAPPHKGVWTPGVIHTQEDVREATKRVHLDLDLARAWRQLERPDIAEPLLQEAISVADIAGRRTNLEQCVNELIALYKAAGRDKDAADLQARLDKLPPAEPEAGSATGP